MKYLSKHFNSKFYLTYYFQINVGQVLIIDSFKFNINYLFLVLNLNNYKIMK